MSDSNKKFIEYYQDQLKFKKREAMEMLSDYLNNSDPLELNFNKLDGLLEDIYKLENLEQTFKKHVLPKHERD